jgi:hypothetical protein
VTILGLYTKFIEAEREHKCEKTQVSPALPDTMERGRGAHSRLNMLGILDPKDVAAETDKRLAQLCAEAGKDLRKFTDQLCGEIQKSGAEVERNLIRERTWAGLSASGVAQGRI